MPDQAKIFKTLGKIIALFVVILIAINILYIVTACTSRQCLVVNFSTIALLLWAIVFLFIVLKYSKKDK